MTEASLPTYRDLRIELEKAGCFNTAPLFAVLALFGNLAASVSLFVISSKAPAWGAIPLFVLGSFFFFRVGWLMHDSAHGGTFRSAAGNRFFASLTSGILGEFPSGWRHGHNRHHVSTNIRGKDMDQRERWNPSLRYASRLRAWIALFLFSRVGSAHLPASLLFLGLRDGYFCYQQNRKRFFPELCAALTGLALQVAFFVSFFGAFKGVLLFFANLSIGMIYLNSAFAGNHYDLPSFSPEEAEKFKYEELQAYTTRNYTGGFWSRLVFGGLENQLEHHFFPSLPRHQLKNAAPIVRRFCQKRKIPYNETSFFHAYMGVLDFHVMDEAK